MSFYNKWKEFRMVADNNFYPTKEVYEKRDIAIDTICNESNELLLADLRDIVCDLVGIDPDYDIYQYSGLNHVYTELYLRLKNKDVQNTKK